eukprot:TRINITY_DN24708_c0_g1_i1.p1 TRINITY_DN24708_c0_g1~~TRINITY_DN24708_c0_g1_i1.p1  ORF type:complete len:197 (+),score=40.06 TRINITY_DN24708_c0_g1_i1:59-649(+)
MRLLLFATVLVLALADLKIPIMPRKVSTLDPALLLEIVRGLGYDATQRDNGSVYIYIEGENDEKKLLDMAWSDHDTLLLRAAWNSPHTELGDLPIINTWNQHYRFAKVSIQDNPNSELPGEDQEPGNTLIIMHMDQFMPVRAGKPAITDTVKKSINIYKTSVVAFDKFIVDIYKKAVELAKERAKTKSEAADGEEA